MSKESGKNSRKLMKNFLRLKLDMEVDIDGMLVNETKKVGLYLKKIFII